MARRPNCSCRLIASPRSHDRGRNVIFRRRAGVAQRAVLAIKFVENLVAMCADPILVETGDCQGFSIHKGERLGRIINYKIK